MKIGKIEIFLKRRASEPTLGDSITIRFASLGLGLALVAIIIMANGVGPLETLVLYGNIFATAFFTPYGILATIVRFIPLLCIAVGLAIPFKARVDNIGAEGQFLMGAIAATGTAFLFSYLPIFLLIPLMFLVGFAAGALWALPVAIFRAKGGFKGSDVVLSFLLVFPAFFLMEHLVSGPWRDQTGWGFPMTPLFPSSSQIPRLPGTRIHLTIFLVLAITFLLFYYLVKTKAGIPKSKLGYEINVMGKNPEAGEAIGMNFLKIALVTMAISGGLAGIAGVGEVAGIHLRLRLGVATGYGFTAIAVAYLGGLNPLGIIASSFFFAALLAGGVAINAAGLPVTIIDLFNGAILFFILIAELLLKYKIEWRTL